jgi:hypothetical protein
MLFCLCNDLPQLMDERQRLPTNTKVKAGDGVIGSGLHGQLRSRTTASNTLSSCSVSIRRTDDLELVAALGGGFVMLERGPKGTESIHPSKPFCEET